MLGQLVHSPVPDVSLYLPEGHIEHGKLPTVFLNVPAGHIEQTPEAPETLSAPLKPALHLQVESCDDHSELPSEHADKHGNTQPCV